MFVGGVIIIIIFFCICVLFVLGCALSKEQTNTYSPTQRTADTCLSPSQMSKQSENKQYTGLLEQKRLVNEYASSELVKHILNNICNGDYKSYKPREIIISHDNIKGDCSGRIIEFDFVSNRVPVFRQVVEQINTKKEDLVRPQVAMSEAINILMGNEYEIIDNAEIIYREVHYNSDESGLLVFYRSNYVLMRLKAIKQF